MTQVNTEHLISLTKKIDEEAKQLNQTVNTLNLIRAIFNDKDWNQASIFELVDEALGNIPERCARVIRMRFGLADGKAMNLEEVGKAFGVTRERIRQIEAKAFRMLRHPARRGILLGYGEKYQETYKRKQKEQRQAAASKFELKINPNVASTAIGLFGFPTRVENALLKARYEYADEVSVTPDKALLKARGIGVGVLKIIREKIPFIPKDEMLKYFNARLKTH